MDDPNLALPQSSRKSYAVIGLKKLVLDMNRMLSGCVRPCSARRIVRCLPIHGLSSAEPDAPDSIQPSELAPRPSFPSREARLIKALDVVANCAQTL
jgi:hypothetical protein